MDDGALSTSEMALSLVFDEENTSVVYADEEAARKSAEKNGKVETFSLAEALEVEADFIASEKTVESADARLIDASTSLSSPVDADARKS